MAQSSSIKTIPLIQLDSASFNGTYQLAGVLPSHVPILRITNASGVGIYISFDGSTNADYVLSNTSLQVQMFAYASNYYNAAFSKGVKVFIKGAASTGLVFVAGYYQPTVA